MAMWPGRDEKGAFIRVLGSEESMDAHVVDIPAKGNTKAEKYMFEEEIVILSGRGATTICFEVEKKATFEWQKGSVFSPPMNSTPLYLYAAGHELSRLLAIASATVTFNL